MVFCVKKNNMYLTIYIMHNFNWEKKGGWARGVCGLEAEGWRWGLGEEGVWPLPELFFLLLLFPSNSADVFAASHFSLTLSLSNSVSNYSYPKQALTPLLWALCSSCATLLSPCHYALCMAKPASCLSPPLQPFSVVADCMPIATFHLQ